MIKTVDNYFDFDQKGIILPDDKDERANDIENNYFALSTSKSLKPLYMTLQNFKNNHEPPIILFEKEDSDDDLIISIQKINDKFIAQTGNYIGRFKYEKTDIEIHSRFSDLFLKRMLNFSNDAYLDTEVFKAKEIKKENVDYTKFIIYHIFLQKLEKAFLLGIPKRYETLKHHEAYIRGRVDINRFIKKDIPYKGKVSSTSREQKEDQNIINVLYRAIIAIEKSNFSTSFISNIKTHLKQNRSNTLVTKDTIQKALNSKALLNPIFTPYKSVLEYAKMILQMDGLEIKEKENKESFGFLVNVAGLFEIYLYKLLQLNFPDWIVEHELEKGVYDNNFFARKIKPDIVMQKDNKVMVFDAKSKKMEFGGRNKYGAGDLDRNDFFQINTYMTYYDKQKDLEVIAGGLLYPIGKEFDESKAHSNNWFGDSKTKFIVDGIDLSYIEKGVTEEQSEEKNTSMNKIVNAEKKFIERIKGTCYVGR